MPAVFNEYQGEVETDLLPAAELEPVLVRLPVAWEQRPERLSGRLAALELEKREQQREI